MAKKQSTIKNSFNVKITDNKVNADIVVNLGSGKTRISFNGNLKGKF